MARILVVDDEPHVTRVTRMALERAGHEVVVAGNGEEALAALEAGAFEAMVTDITMPGMTGLELCERVRHQLELEAMPIFVVTSRVEDEFRNWARAFSRLEFVEKPLSLRRLVARLEASLAEEKATT